jgi:type IV pilus assembly protein PilB
MMELRRPQTGNLAVETAASSDVTAADGRPLADLVADILAGTGLIDAADLDAVRVRAGGGSIARALVEQGVASEEDVAHALAARYGLDFVDLSETKVSPDAARMIPLNVLERVIAIPYAQEGDVLRVAVSDPQNLQGLDELRLASRLRVEVTVTTSGVIVEELRRLSRAAATVDVEELQIAALDENDELEADDGISDAPLVRLVNAILFQAAEDGASDVHFEPREDALVVRFRIDGVLHEAQRVPKRMAAGMTTRLKVLAKLDIAERRKPQDGRISLNAAAAGRVLDVRVATLPTVEGEAVTLRLLDKSRRAPTLEELGMPDVMRERLRLIIRKPTGALLVTGPTGSGKSTTLYAALAEINRPEINIITVEDPVEYRLTGVNQMQINVRAGLLFSTALRAILRSDPDVVMVGEIRDPETAKISIEAALTGHFVLSTLHTNDAPGAITRLNEMGVEPFLTGSAVSAVLAQRLARKLCTHCAEMYAPSQKEVFSAGIDPGTVGDGLVLYRKRGCSRCNQTGYKGRLGVFQLLEMSDTLEELAARKASRDELARIAASEGMQTLWHDGLAKVAAGLTSLEELARVVTI